MGRCAASGRRGGAPAPNSGFAGPTDAGRLGAAGAFLGVTAFLRGDFWGLGSDGANILVEGDTHRVAGEVDGRADLGAADWGLGVVGPCFLGFHRSDKKPD